MVDIIAKNSLRGKRLERYKGYKAHKYRQIVETRDFVVIRSFYPMRKGSDSIERIIDIRYFKDTGYIKDITTFDVRHNGNLSSPKEIINFSKEFGYTINFLNIHSFYSFVNAFVKNLKEHLNVGQNGKVRFDHIKISKKLQKVYKKKLEDYGLLLEIYLDNRFNYSISRIKVDHVVEIIKPGYRVVFRIINKQKYRSYGRNYLMRIFRKLARS